jgi:hypothetical protein
VKKSTKAALLSAFIFPGIGHIFLKKYIAGVVLAGAAFAALYYLTSKTVEKAFQITEKIQSGEVQLDVESITELVSKQSTDTDEQQLSIATIAFIICWLAGIIDSYRVGCLRDKE